MAHFISKFLVIASSLLALSNAQDNNGLTAQTQQGTVTGSLVLPTVRRFLGVPYATAGRWELPTSPSMRSTALNATQFGDSCTQRLDDGTKDILGLMGVAVPDVPASDDCLNLNIWAPSVGRKQDTAVLLWIYGGSYQWGTGNMIFYDGTNFVRDNDDITIVTINYRTNIFGQPNAPQLVSSTQSQNFGLLDTEAAIRWVHSNIAAFGGDPERITIFGQSAGAVTADAWAYSHPSDTIVKGIITHSGTLDLATSIPFERIAVDNPDTDSWNKVADKVGCGSSATPEQLACMRAVDAPVLEQATIDAGTAFHPIVDDITIISNVRERGAAGNFLHVPMLGGITAQEADIFVVEWEKTNLDGPFASLIPGREEIAKKVSDAITKVIFDCPASKAASERSRAGVPTWRYQYEGVFPDISQRSDLRAYHSSDIPIVFGTYNASTASTGPTESEIALSKLAQAAWVAFARDPANGLGDAPFSWPKIGSGGDDSVLLGNSANPSGATFASSSDLDAGCDDLTVLIELIKATGIQIPL